MSSSRFTTFVHGQFVRTVVVLGGIMAAGWTLTDFLGGIYREVRFPSLLSFTWAWRTTPERESLVTIRLEPAGGGTRLVFRHEQFFDQAARDRHEGGWSGTFRKLDRFLQGETSAS